MRILSAKDVAASIDMDAAIAAVERAFIAHARGATRLADRVVLPVSGGDGRDTVGTTLLMAAQILPDALAAKVVSVFDANRDTGRPGTTGAAFVLDPQSGEMLAMIDAGSMTALRTGAVVGVATRALARANARRAALIGCGTQARAQLLALDVVGQLEVCAIHGRRPERLAAFIDEMSERVQLRLEAHESAATALAGADVVCAATGSSTPVFDGAELGEGVHVNAIGSFRLDMQELDPTTLSNARIIVDDLEAACAEAGELVAAQEAGITSRDEWRTLGDVLIDGERSGRQSNSERTVFKSVGLAIQDAAVAPLLLAAAERAGRGIEIEL